MNTWYLSIGDSKKAITKQEAIGMDYWILSLFE